MSITPMIKLHKREKWKPVPVDDSLAAFGYSWSGKSWQLDGKDVDRLNFPANMAPDVFDDMPVVFYYRVVKAARLDWHQFWSWWPYNPKNYPPTKHGVGEHEGDWEVIQIACKDEAGTDPILMTCSQHNGGERRHYWDVELSEGSEGNPVVYVAVDSHANYFSPVRNVTDWADGDGQHLLPELYPFGNWKQWMGQWGNSDNSPGPLSTRRMWKAPHAEHSQARG